MTKDIENSSWGRAIPWLLSLACVITLTVIGKFLIQNIEWYKQTVFDVEMSNMQEPLYRIHAYHIHMSMIKRSVGLFSGFAIMFLGLGVAFFSLRSITDLGVESKVWSVKVATASPGIIALLVGGTIIMFTINSKDEFAGFPTVIDPNYNKQNQEETKMTEVEDPFASTESSECPLNP